MTIYVIRNKIITSFASCHMLFVMTKSKISSRPVELPSERISCAVLLFFFRFSCNSVFLHSRFIRQNSTSAPLSFSGSFTGLLTRRRTVLHAPASRYANRACNQHFYWPNPAVHTNIETRQNTNSTLCVRVSLHFWHTSGCELPNHHRTDLESFMEFGNLRGLTAGPHIPADRSVAHGSFPNSSGACAHH